MRASGRNSVDTVAHGAHDTSLMNETLNRFIERVTYHNPDNGFAVLRVKVRGRADLVTDVGNTTR